MVWAVIQVQEFEQPHATWHAKNVLQDTSVASWRGTRILWVTRRLDLVLIANRHHPLNEVVDALPEHICSGDAGFRNRGIGIQVSRTELAGSGAPAEFYFASARHTENTHVVLESRHSNGGTG